MRTKRWMLPALVFVLSAGCAKKEAAAPAAEAPPAAPAAEVAAPAVAQPTPAAGSPAPQAAPAAAAPAVAASVIATQETNWPGIVAEVTEFRRKGNTLTARVRLRNQSPETVRPDLRYGEVYVMDAAAGKKYEVLKDEKGAYIAALRTGWEDRWYDDIPAGQIMTIWMKFPAPPPEVESVTLQITNVPPFEDVPIQD